MKLSFLFTACIAISTGIFAQDTAKYNQKANQIKKAIWDNPSPDFKVTTVPSNLEKESAIVLARSYSSQRTSNGKYKFLIAGATTHTEKVTTLHERIKINDKVSLVDYSTLAYQKRLDKTSKYLLGNKVTNKHDTYLGVKIIKPDGKEITVDTREEILIKDDKQDQQGILAIPGLQVGDILDYYIAQEETTDNNEGNAFKDNEDILILADEYPILSYNIDYQFNNKVYVKYIYANGAPHFTESHNAAGDLVLNLKLTNLAKYESQLWTSPLRQFPYIEIGSSYVNKYNEAELGEKHLANNTSLLEGNKKLFAAEFGVNQGFPTLDKKLKDFFTSKTPLKENTLDSVMKVLYNLWRYQVFDTYLGVEVLKINELNYREAQNKISAVSLSEILTGLDVNHDVLLVASRNRNTLENVYGLSDFTACIRINGNGDKPMYMFFDDVFTQFNEIPARYQGEKAIVMHPNFTSGGHYTFTYIDFVMPVVEAANNKIDEKINVDFYGTDGSKLKVTREVKETGAMRHEDQKLLIPVEDVDNELSDLAQGESIDARLKKQNYTKKMGEDFSFAFDQEREEMIKNFTHEITGQFDQEPAEVTNFKVTHTALDTKTFEFSSDFVLNNLVQKAGPNFIIDAGKLTGYFLNLDEKDKTRTIDVYMPAARTLSFTITIPVPVGFNVKGTEEMTLTKANDAGSFSSVAQLKGNFVIISVTRVYAHNFLKAADWPQLRDLLETASTFNDLKLLLEKKG